MKNLISKKATVTKIEIDHDNSKLVTVSLENNEKEVLIISKLVKIYNNYDFKTINPSKIDIGQEIFIYINKDTPVMMSLPPKYVPILLVVNSNPGFMSHKFDTFDHNLISGDKTIQISEHFLDVIASDKNVPLVKELLKNQNLLVFYKESTKSIPAIVNPKKIIIL